MVLFESDIEEDYTNLVNEFLKAGMVINVQSMSGTQGELASIDFQDDKYVYRIILEKEYINSYSNKKIEIRKYDKTPCEFCTYWNSNGIVLYEKIYYLVSRYENVYTTDTKEITSIREKQEQRAKNCDSEYINIMFNKNILKVINNKKGYKTVKLKDIKRVVKFIKYDTTYMIFFNKKDTLYFSNKK